MSICSAVCVRSLSDGLKNKSRRGLKIVRGCVCVRLSSAIQITCVRKIFITARVDWQPHETRIYIRRNTLGLYRIIAWGTFMTCITSVVPGLWTIKRAYLYILFFITFTCIRNCVTKKNILLCLKFNEKIPVVTLQKLCVRRSFVLMVYKLFASLSGYQASPFFYLIKIQWYISGSLIELITWTWQKKRIFVIWLFYKILIREACKLYFPIFYVP